MTAIITWLLKIIAFQIDNAGELPTTKNVFPTGGVPDNFPVELLPMDYGGEAPTVEELDAITKSLLDKYRHWLIETEHLKADESKRVKKAGFWSLFSGKSEQQVELDEKTILRNLQID